MKQKYLELMKTAIDSYSYEHIEELYKENLEKGIKEHGISRIASVLGILISKGMKQDYYDLWIKIMDMCCDQLPNIKDGNDFAVREIMSCIIETKGVVPKEKTDEWLSSIKKIDYRKNYGVFAKSVDDNAHNIAVYNMAGEYLRQINGMCDTEEYFNIQIPCQLKMFDDNGMYMDPGCPMLYDIATRVQFCLLLFYGYNGKYKEQLDENLKKGAKMSLMMQSACFEIPYGGRSNQMVFNEAYQCACFEYEAARYKKEGNLELAGQFKQAARLSYEAILRMVASKPAKHVKNGFGWNSLFGCEWYAYYDKYMITMGSFAYLAYLFCDETVEERTCPAQKGGYAVNTSDAFHRIFANACGYSIQIDTRADKGYDATGLGRIHKRDIPPETALSCPFPKAPKYLIQDVIMTKMPDREEISVYEKENPGYLSITPVIIGKDGDCIRLCDFYENIESKLDIFKQAEDIVEFAVTYKSESFTGFTYIKERYILDKEGVHVCFSCDTEETYTLGYEVPVIRTDGNAVSETSFTDKMIICRYKNHEYIIETEGCSITMDDEYSNRNGIYDKAVVLRKGNKPLNINFKIK